MLQIIREHAQGWVIRSIIALIVIAFTFWGIHGYFLGGNSATSAVAIVNGVQITKEQLAVAYERLRRQVQIQSGSSYVFKTKDESVLKLRALQTLTEIEALKQASVRDGFVISDRQIDNYLENMPEFQVNGRFSTQRFQEVLSSTLLSTSDFFELIRTSLLIDQPRLGVLLTSFAAPLETRYTISLVNQERDFSYMIFSPQVFQAQLGTISNEKINAYYNANKQLFMTPEQVSIEYVMLSLKDLAEKIVPNEAALKAMYNENINTYTEPMSWRLTGIEIPVSVEASAADWDKALKDAEKVIAKLSDETTFSDYQKKYPLSGSLGNEFLTLSQIPEAWQKSVSSLQKKGQLSAPIKSSAGIVILKLLDVHEAKIQTFDAVRNKVNEAYVHQRAEEQFAQLRDQLSELTYQHPDSLKVAEEKLGLPVKVTELFSRDAAATGIANNKKVRDVSFSDDILAMKNNSDVIPLNADSAIVVRVKSHLKPALLPLESVRKQIEDKIRRQSLDNSAKVLVSEMVKQLQSNQLTEASISSKYKLEWNNAGYMGRYGSKVDGAILNLAFSLPRPSDKKDRSVVYGTTRLHNGNYALVALKNVKDGVVPDDKQLAVFAEQVQNSDALLEYELLKQSILNKTKIEVIENQ